MSSTLTPETLKSLAVAAMTAEVQYHIGRIEAEEIVYKHLPLLDGVAGDNVILSREDRAAVAELIDGSTVEMEVTFK